MRGRWQYSVGFKLVAFLNRRINVRVSSPAVFVIFDILTGRRFILVAVGASAKLVALALP
ncbi:MAG TPA: hypothetical protein VK604_12220 [Bryobacteraceae bacterium]|nr:hypothetical protein [Bryobacteraceae bacterium]